MRVAILNDIGQADYHVGDEAMCHAAAAALGARGILEPVLLTRDVEHTAARHPAAVPVPTIVFPWPPEDRRRYLDEIRAVLAGRTDALPPEDQVFALIEALRTVDAVLIGGGGNLNSRFGWLLCERAAVVEIARSLDLPVVISGQTLGPELTVAERPVLARMLETAVLVGLRDADSLRLARELCPDHPGLRPCPDDSVGWALELLAAPWPAVEPGPAAGPAAPAPAPTDAPPPAASDASSAAPSDPPPAAQPLRETPADPTRPRIVATFAPTGGPFDQHEAAEVFAVVLDALATRTGGTVELIPHLAVPGSGGGDEGFHRSIAARMRTEAVEHPVEEAGTSLRRMLTADYVVSSRYHPIVFGLAGGATVLPIAVDRYSEIRMSGACATWGISGQVVPLAALITPREVAWDTHQAAQRWTQEAVEGRRESAAELLARRAAVREEAASWWDGVLVGLSGALPGAPEQPQVPAAGAGTEISRALRRDWSAPVADVRPGSRATVAIIMRTMDRALLLERALDDVLDQSFADWRLVVVNDGGDPEPVRRLVEARAERFRGRAQVISHRRRMGMEAASNRGLRAVDSDFVVIHDDDDTWHPLFLQRAVAHLERPSCTEAGVMARTEIRYEEIDAGAQPPVIRETGRAIFWADLHSITLADLLSINRAVPISFLYRRELHGLVGDYDESLPAVGDWEFHLRVAQAATIGFLDGEPLAFWHQRPAAVDELGNSMFSAREEHREHDLRVRERHLQEWTRENGIGLPLWMARELQDLRERLEVMRVDQQRLLLQHGELLELMRAHHLESLETERRIKEHSLVGRLGRLLRRILPRR